MRTRPARTPVTVEVTALQAQRAEDRARHRYRRRRSQLSGRIAARPRRAGALRLQGQGRAQAARGRGPAGGGCRSRPMPSRPTTRTRSTSTSAAPSPSYRGTVRYATLPAGMSMKLAGDTALDDFRANSVIAHPVARPRAHHQPVAELEDAEPARPAGQPWCPARRRTVDVRETTLTDFFARVIIDPTGRLNLLNLTKKARGTEADAAAARGSGRSLHAAQGPGRHDHHDDEPRRRRRPSGGAPVPAENMVGGAPEPATPAAAAAPVATAQADSGPAPVINFGPMSLVNGKIDFTDLFVKPNYSADLSELTGKLSAFSSNPPKGERRPRWPTSNCAARRSRQPRWKSPASSIRWPSRSNSTSRPRCATSTWRRCRRTRCATPATASSAAS